MKQIEEDTNYEENLVIAELLRGGISLRAAVKIGIVQVKWGGTPLSAADICTLEDDLDLDPNDEVLASEILGNYFEWDKETVHKHCCPICGQQLEGDIVAVGQAIFAHQIVHHHESMLENLDAFDQDQGGEDDA